MELFVAHQAPIVNQAVVRAAAPIIYQEAMGLPKEDVVTLPPDPIQEQPTYEAALAAFEALPEIRVLFDNGAGTSPTGSTTPGNPYPGFEQSFSAFPIPGTEAQSWYLGPDGSLTEQAPTAEGVDSYTSNANATPLTDYSTNTGSGGLWGDASEWEWNWTQPQAGSAVSYVSAPLTSDTTAIGGGAVHLWVKSSTPDVDLQATVSEVRPDGNETFVQDGWLRASERKLATSSDNMFKQKPTLLQPIPTFLASDVQPMPADEFVPVVIPLYFEGHVYRAGSRIRVTIAAPNGTEPVWSFSQTQPEGTTATESIAFSPGMPSSLILPIVPGVDVPTGLPACPSLRNEPCRPYGAIRERRLLTSAHASANGEMGRVTRASRRSGAGARDRRDRGGAPGPAGSSAERGEEKGGRQRARDPGPADRGAGGRDGAGTGAARALERGMAVSERLLSHLRHGDARGWGEPLDGLRL